MLWRLQGTQVRYFNGDKGAGSGGGTSDGDGNKTGDQNPQPNAGAGAENNGGEKGKEKPGEKPDPKEEPKFTQADMDREIQKRLDREKQNRENEDKKKQGQFEQLYNELKPRFDQAETDINNVTTERDELAAILEGQIKTEIEAWPDEVKKLYPKNSALKDRMQWVNDSRDLAKRLSTGAKPVNGEHGNNKGGGAGTTHPERGYMSRYSPPVPVTSK